MKNYIKRKISIFNQSVQDKAKCTEIIDEQTKNNQ